MRRTLVTFLLLILCLARIEAYVDRSDADSIRVEVSERNPNLRLEMAYSAMHQVILKQIKWRSEDIFSPLEIPCNPEIDFDSPDRLMTSYEADRPGWIVVSVERQAIENDIDRYVSQPMSDAQVHHEKAQRALKEPWTAMYEYFEALEIASRIPVVGSGPLEDFLRQLVESARDFFGRITITLPQSIILPEDEQFKAKLRIYYRAQDDEIIPMRGVPFMVNGRMVRSGLDGSIPITESDFDGSQAISYRLEMPEEFEALLPDAKGEINIRRLRPAKALFQAVGEFPASLREIMWTLGIETAESEEEATHVVQLDFIRTGNTKLWNYRGYVAVLRAKLILKEKDGNTLREWKTDEIEAFSGVSQKDAGIKARNKAIDQLERMLVE